MAIMGFVMMDDDEIKEELLNIVLFLLVNGPRRYLKHRTCLLCEGVRLSDPFTKSRSGGFKVFEHKDTCPVDMADKIVASLDI